MGYLTREYFVWFGLVILHSLQRWMHMEIIVVAYDGEMMVMMVLFSGRISWMKRLQQFTPLKTESPMFNGKYIFKRRMFHCHVNFRGSNDPCTSLPPHILQLTG